MKLYGIINPIVNCHMAKNPRKKRRSKKKKNSHLNATHSSKFEFYEIESPFKDIPKKELFKLAKQMGEEFEKKFDESLSNLKKQILTIEPTLLLSYFALYGLTSFAGVDRELTDDKPIYQHFVEFLQGLVLQYKWDHFNVRPILPSDFHDFYDLLQMTMTSFHMRRMSQFESSMSDEQRKQFFTLQHLRSNTMVIRNWGYPDQIENIASKLFAPLDDIIEEKKGVRITDLIKMCQNIFQEAINRINNHRKLLYPMVSAKKTSAVVEAYHSAFPEIKTKPLEYLQLARERNWSIDEVKQSLISHSNLRLPEIYSFTLDDFVKAYPNKIDKNVLIDVLTKWSFSFGDLANFNTEHFFMGNPIWYQPLIRIDTQKFFLPILGLFLSFCIEIMEKVFEDDEELLARYEDRRGKFLEEEVEGLFSNSFSSAKIYRGSLWHDPESNKDFENDLLVIIDSYLIVVEAKSGKLTEPAKRGAELRLKSKIKELIVEPSVQANRFANYLSQNKSRHEFKTKHGKVNYVDTSNIYTVIRLNVTLENLSALSMRLPSLEEAGLIKEQIDLVPSIAFADLEIVFEILDRTSEKLHYLVRRSEFEKNANYIGDELDLLVFYIETGFNIGDTEYDGTSLNLFNLSKNLDSYFMKEWHLNDIAKPERKYIKWWKDLLSIIEAKNKPRWSEIGYILLNCSFDDQLLFQQMFNKLKRKLELKSKMTESDQAAVLFNGPSQRKDVIVGLPYKGVSKEDRNRWLYNIATNAMVQAPSNRAIIMAINIDENHYPYSTIGLTELNKGNTN